MASALSLSNAEPSPVPVCNVATIEEELHALWRQVAASHPEGAAAVTRVCTLTLIAYGHGPALGQRVRRAVPDVFAAHPCRAVLIEATASVDELSAWVSTVCQRPSAGGEQVCCEQISLAVGERMRERLTGTVLPLVVSGLPLFVWWPGPWPQNSGVRARLYAQADRWIYDGADFLAPLMDFGRAAALLDEHPATAPTDLAWARLLPWRWMVAQAFDAPTTQPLLHELGSVEIAAPAAQGLLLLGWLAVCLGWEAAALEAITGGQHVICMASHGPVSVTLRETAQVEQVLLSAGERRVNVICPDAQLVRAQGEGVALPSLAGELGALDDGSLLERELSLHGRDRVYESVLRFLARCNPT